MAVGAPPRDVEKRGEIPSPLRRPLSPSPGRSSKEAKGVPSRKNVAPTPRSGDESRYWQKVRESTRGPARRPAGKEEHLMVFLVNAGVWIHLRHLVLVELEKNGGAKLHFSEGSDLTISKSDYENLTPRMVMW